MDCEYIHSDSVKYSSELLYYFLEEITVLFTTLHLFDSLNYLLLCRLHTTSEPKQQFFKSHYKIDTWIEKNSDSDKQKNAEYQTTLKIHSLQLMFKCISILAITINLSHTWDSWDVSTIYYAVYSITNFKATPDNQDDTHLR